MVGTSLVLDPIWRSGDESGLECGSSKKLSLSSSSNEAGMEDLAGASSVLAFLRSASMRRSIAVNSCWMSLVAPYECGGEKR